MRKRILAILGIIAMLLLITAVSGCSELQSFLPSPSPLSGPVHSDESSPISSTKDVTITRSGSTITANGMFPYNTKEIKDPFLLKEGNATVNINLQGGGYGCSVSLVYKRPGSQSTSYITVYTMDEKRLYQATKTIVLPYTGDYYLVVNWYDKWSVTISQ